jgi:HD superfamily phosphohydrolase
VIVEKLYRDPIHDLIALNKNSREDQLLMQLIDSMPLQRLRRIRQLGMAYLAYQGAEHSRFSHSLGVLHLATRILDHLSKEWRVTAFQRLAVRCAALVHDVGHGPFSHVFENVTGIPHEVWTERILLSRSSELYQLLASYSRRLPAAIVEIIQGRSQPPFLSQIIASQLDADRFDYLLRDSLMTGVKYGVYELERLIRVLRLDHLGQRIIVAENGVPPVEKYLQARYHMYTQVYLHKTVRAAESMLILVLRRAKELCSDNPKQSHVPIPEPLKRLLAQAPPPTIEDFLSVTDDTLYYALNEWQDCPDEILRTLSRGLLRRQLFKTIDVSSIKNLEEKLAKAKQLIASQGFDPRYFLMIYESKSLAYQPYVAKAKRLHHHIFVQTKESKEAYRDIATVSPLVAGLSRASAHVRRLVFPEHLGNLCLRDAFGKLFQS